MSEHENGNLLDILRNPGGKPYSLSHRMKVLNILFYYLSASLSPSATWVSYSAALIPAQVEQWIDDNGKGRQGPGSSHEVSNQGLT